MKHISVLPIHADQGIVSDETALVQAARADPEVFATLYNRYLARIYRYLRARTSSDDDAADLTQQVFLKALDALPGYREQRAPFAAWLFRIAHNVATDAYRRRRNTLSIDLLPEALHHGGGGDPETVIIRQEAVARVRALLGRLDEEKRWARHWFLGAGSSAFLAELAAVLSFGVVCDSSVASDYRAGGRMVLGIHRQIPT